MSKKKANTKNLTSLLSGFLIACLLISFMIALVWQGGDILTNVGELAVIMAGFGATLGYQIGTSMKKSFGSFLWSIGFSSTILAAFLAFAITQDFSVTPILVLVLGTSLGGFATLVISGEIEHMERLEGFIGRLFQWMGAALLVLHVSVAYLFPSAGFVVNQLMTGVTNPNLVATWFALLLVDIAAILLMYRFVEQKAPEVPESD